MTQKRRRYGSAIFEGQPAVDAVSKQAWYIGPISDGARRLFEQYSKLEPEHVVLHVVTMVDLSKSKCSFILPHLERRYVSQIG